MNNNFVNTGSCSVIIGPGHYGKFITPKKNKLLKITLIIPNHNEFKHLKKIKQIDNYQEYYTIPDEEAVILKPSDNFYSHLCRLVEDKDMEILNYNDSLSCHYMDYGGSKDVFDTFNDLINHNDCNIWKSYRIITSFIRKISYGLYFLHQIKIAHLDIKPENIVVNLAKKDFKIIDFGFAATSPFTKFLDDIRGTPGYFPKHFDDIKYDKWTPEIKANDFDYVNKKDYPHLKDSTLVYKIDSFCFGRLIFMLKSIYDEYTEYYCCNLEKSVGLRIDDMIKLLIENDVHRRITIEELITKFDL